MNEIKTEGPVCQQQSDSKNSDVHPETLGVAEKKKRNLAKYIVVRRSDGEAQAQTGKIGDIIIDVDADITRKDAIPDAIRSKGESGEFEFFKSVGGMKIKTVVREDVW